MRYKHSLAFFLILLCLPSYGHAQLWSGILDPSRATDWTTAGVKGGIPSGSWTQCGSTIAAYTGSAATINNAVAGCGANQYVQLGAGTFTLSTAIQIANSGVVLRGMGADQTFLIINGSTTACSTGHSAVLICAAWNPWNSILADWTAGYSQGTTQITLDTVSGLAVGNFIMLDQLDDSSDGWPGTGDIYVCETAGAACSESGGGGNDSPPNRAESEFHEVTSITGSGPYTVTLATPLRAPNWRSDRSPGAVWYPSVVSNSGIENLSIDWTGIQGVTFSSGINFSWAKDSWMKGVRVIDTGSTTGCPLLSPVNVIHAFRITVEDSYVFGPYNNAVCVAQFTLSCSGDMLVQNNIVHRGNQPIYMNGPVSGSAVAYNYTVGTTDTAALDTHAAGEYMDLWEGNISTGFSSDSIHGSHFMQSIFRNVWSGTPLPAYARQPFFMESFGRFHNIIANVLGDPSFTHYESNLAYDDNAIYNLGWNESAGINSDSNVKRTMMRWGNWDSVTSAVRWCGNSSDTGWSTTCSSTSEVPSGITNFPNPVPSKGDTSAGQAPFPASFYLSSKPSWWTFPSGNASTPWPGIGPEVTGGNIQNTSGHVYLNPAGNCYLNVMNGPVDGSGGPLSFNAGKCYPPAPPTEVEAVAD